MLNHLTPAAPPASRNVAALPPVANGSTTPAIKTRIFNKFKYVICASSIKSRLSLHPIHLLQPLPSFLSFSFLFEFFFYNYQN